MNKNPLNLPVPKFDGSCNIEIRLGRSGSKVLKSGVEVVSGAFRAQARLITKSSSPYSLDNPEQAEQILKIALDNQ